MFGPWSEVEERTTAISNEVMAVIFSVQGLVTLLEEGDFDMDNPESLRQLRRRLRDWTLARLGNIRSELDEFERHINVVVDDLTKHIEQEE